MHFTGLITALAAIRLVTAASAVDAPAAKTSAVAYLDKFDDLKVLPVSTGETNKVGVYHALDYSGISVASGQINTGKAPPSPPNFIFGGVINTQQFQLLPANSSVLYFDLQSLYYACAPTVGGAVGASISCTIQFAGRKAPQFGGSTAVQELVYDGGLLNGAFNRTSFPSKGFSGLVEVNIAIISATGTTAIVSPNFDNVGYVAHFKT